MYVTLDAGPSCQIVTRVVYALNSGHVPAGMFALHTCDDEQCVNFNHLFLGSHWENMQDAREKRIIRRHQYLPRRTPITPEQRELFFSRE